MKDVEWRLVAELMKNSRRSDRELANILNISQPTVSRMRARLEKEVIKGYTISANLPRLGFQLLAVTFGRLNPGKKPDSEMTQLDKNFVEKQSNIIFSSTGQGMSSDRIIMSLHRSYSEYAKFMRDFKEKCRELYTVTETFLVSLETDDMSKSLTMQDLASRLEPEEKSV